MSVNRAKGNMYDDIEMTWNPISGRCNHRCVYCYCEYFWRMMKDNSLKLKESYFNDNLGEGNRIFVGSSTDMFAENVPAEWIEEVLSHLTLNYPDNEYLFQSKNPGRFRDFEDKVPPNTILATTIETNRQDLIRQYSRAPDVYARVHAMKELKIRNGFPTQITIEPIMDFDLLRFVDMICQSRVNKVYIGADSKNSELPEPQSAKVSDLIHELSIFTQVKLKRNLARIVN